MALPNTVLTIDYDTPIAAFNVVYQLTPGYVFHYTKNIETLLLRLQNDLPVNLKNFRVRTVNPGTDLYTLYGDNTLILMQADAQSPLTVPTLRISGTVLYWNSGASYNFEIASDSGFTSIVGSYSGSNTTFDYSTLNLSAGTYYARVQNTTADSAWSNVVTIVVA